MADYVPAIRGKMGDWVYYLTVMKLGKVANEVTFADKLHSASELDELIQREIGVRVEREMVPYLLNQSQRFYGSIIVAVYGGEPEFHEVKVSEGHHLIDEDSSRSSYGFGLLRFDGSQRYFALDGQHRLSSIKIAVERNPDLAKEDISVILVRHDNSPDGMERTRRLFSTLNRKAVPTKVGLNIAIDEDDPVAICTRRLTREHPYFKPAVVGQPGLVKIREDDKFKLAAKQLYPNKRDEPYFTTLQSLYECNELLIAAFEGGTDVDRSNRPDAELLDSFYNYLAEIWTLLFDHCPDLAPIRERRQKPGSLRIDKNSGGGGSAIARPIGQLVIAETIQRAALQGRKPSDFIPLLCQYVNFNLDNVPWNKLVWNPNARTIIGGKRERTILVYLLMHKFGLRNPAVKSRQLLEDYKKVTQDNKMRLPDRVVEPDADEEETDSDTLSTLPIGDNLGGTE
jgi:DNA sulfur modification protein DndB